uniref:Uncharacterized protein n=2 Tax=Anguilla anguilla TaxID=7936 RepID=A0A0E9PQ21_ANGAN
MSTIQDSGGVQSIVCYSNFLYIYFFVFISKLSHLIYLHMCVLSLK